MSWLQECIHRLSNHLLDCFLRHRDAIISHLNWEKEGLTSDSAELLLKKGENKTCRFDSGRVGETEESIDLISDSDSSDTEFQRPMGKRKTQEYIGWASKALIKFLQSIGTDTTKQLSQYDVESIIFDYIKVRSLFDPTKKKKVICDEKLYSIFRKKSLDRINIYDWKNGGAILQECSYFLHRLLSFYFYILAGINRDASADGMDISDECKELQKNVANGLLRKPTVVELEQKAQLLHDDIAKHWIERELVRLQNCIDRANEKGRRREYP
ncbi:hypothetical protein ACFX11_020262 [Malus domestica]